MDDRRANGWALDLLESCGAVLRGGHFVYTSGRHGSVYVNKDAVYSLPLVISRLCRAVSEAFDGVPIDAVAAPAIGGVILSQWVAYYFRREVIAVYAEKADGGGFEFRRGYGRLLAGRRVLVVEDVLTTGGSLRAVLAAVEAAGGEVAGVAALVNRGGVTAEDVGSRVGLSSLATLPLESFDPADCPLCRTGIPINVEVGKGHEPPAGRPWSDTAG